MFKSKKLAVLAALLSLFMLLSLMAVPAFADDTATTTVEETVTEAGTGEETTAAETETRKEETTTAATGTTDTEKKETLTRSIINLCVGGVLLIVLVVLAIKFRSKIPSWWKGLKSECGKITWCPKDKLKKNVIVVVLIILAIAVVIGVLDFVFSFSVGKLGDLVSMLTKK